MPTELRTIHPVRGLLWGLVSGLGLAIALVLMTVIRLEPLAMTVVVVATALTGLLWSTLGPARVRRDPATPASQPSGAWPRQPGPQPVRDALGGGDPRHSDERPRTAERFVAT